jgi:hypothetical protein
MENFVKPRRFAFFRALSRSQYRQSQQDSSFAEVASLDTVTVARQAAINPPLRLTAMCIFGV